jgi:diacylglycerol kinase (ATP)
MEPKPEDRPSFICARIRSIGFAVRGIVCLVATQGNARVHLVATVAVIIAGLFLKVSAVEWLFLIFAIAAVWVAEGLNTAVEMLADRITTERDPLIGRAKDVAAGAVLIASIASAICGAIIVIPKLLAVFQTTNITVGALL